MTDLAIHVEHLAKKFRVGQERNAFPTLRETLSGGLRRRRRPTWFWPLTDVSFDVRQGDVLGIVGANGAGKSTLLKILSRIIEPTAGRISARGRLGSLLEVGTGFHPELTGRENVFLNGAILGMSRRETAAKFDEIVAFSGIEQYIDTPVKHYSSGMYLRLGFAVAAHIDPDILIVDEVLAVGDAAFQAKCLGKMGELVSEGRTVLIVSHQLPVVQKLCTRVVLLRDGVVAQDGSPQAVIAEHLRGLVRWSDVRAELRSDRAGRGTVRLNDIRVNGHASASLNCGQPACFEFEADGPVDRLNCSITIYDDLGQAITSFDTARAANTDSLDREGATTFQCKIPALPLRPGRYWLDASLMSTGGELEDFLERATSFEVLPGLYDGREASTDTTYGQVEIAHRWCSS